MSAPTVGEVGETALLQALQPYLDTARAESGEVVLGAGDDAALWRAPAGTDIVSTTDTLVAGVHFAQPLLDIAAIDLGWKLLAVSLSDLAAMAADPGPALISLALPAEWPFAMVEALYRGLDECARTYGAALAGGNVSQAPVAVLTSTCIGSVQAGSEMRRTGARPGWDLAVTGALGGAAAALRGQGVVPGAWRARQNRPQPRLAEGSALAAAGVGVALDVSDGLFIDAARLLSPDAPGVVVDADAIPLEAGIREAWIGDWPAIAGGGEDYELLFAGPPGVIARACEAVSSMGVAASVIGRFDTGDGVRLLSAGVEAPAPESGHRHFGR